MQLINIHQGIYARNTAFKNSYKLRGKHIFGFVNESGGEKDVEKTRGVGLDG